MSVGQGSSNMQFQPTYKHAHSEEKANKTLRILYTKKYVTSTGMQVKSFPLIFFEFVKSIHRIKTML
jgi:hypothetical protein